MPSFEKLTGSTPMIRIRCRFDGHERHVYAKLESFNPSGSIKDRMAAYILMRAEAGRRLSPGQPIVEATSGNTGIAFCALGALTKHPVHIFMPDWVSDERKKLMAMYGAELHLVSAREGGFKGALELAEAAAGELGAFYPSQFSSPENAMAHYMGTGVEILSKLPRVDSFVAGVGSGGTLMGVSRRLKEARPVHATALEPDSMPLLSGGKIRGSHLIEGIGDGFIPKLIDRRLIDGVTAVNDLDAVNMAAKLARELGLGVGISSGANFIGALLRQAAGGGTTVTVFPDDSRKYLTTALADPPAPPPGGVSERTELLDYETV